MNGTGSTFQGHHVGRHWFAQLLLVAALLLHASAASAQSPLSEGTRLLEAGDFDKALEILLPEYANAPDAVLAYTIARCYEGLQDDPRALRFYQAAINMRRGLTRDEKRRAKRRKKAIKKRLKNRPKKGTLTVRCEAVGAIVKLDGVEIGRSPLSGLLIRPGPHRLRVEHPHWEPWETRFTVAAYESVSFDAKMRDIPTDVLIHTEPAGAQAKISGTDVQCVTPCLVPLRRGKYQLMITRQGSQPLVHDFVKEPGKLKEVRLALQPVGAAPPVATGGNGFLQLAVNPPGAQITVGGILRGTSPLAAPIIVPAGVVTVQVSLPGYQNWTARVQVAAGKTTNARIQLRPIGAAPSTSPVIAPAVEDSGSGSPAGWALIGTGIGLSVGGALMVALPTVLNEREIDLATRFEIQGNQYISSITRQQALDLESEAKLLSYIGYGAIGVGVGLIIGGAVMVVQADNADAQDPLAPPPVSLNPVFLPGGGGASATWRF